MDERREIFRVYIELYVNTALNQSAFRIDKCHNINIDKAFAWPKLER